MIHKFLAVLGIRNKEEMAFAMLAGGGLAMVGGIYRVVFTPGTMNEWEMGFFTVIFVSGGAIWWKVKED